ncbi:hypothetical protein [Paenibacillus sp. UNC451MF]|uniref:hypothetical protein n=1 Tax=Paenibacillus sp. UNC451MF TaxID=1449063 RepID=UPI000AD38A9D|nr:hypothetical protein [Paenibacillus sp. UNC451MF]
MAASFLMQTGRKDLPEDTRGTSGCKAEAVAVVRNAGVNRLSVNLHLLLRNSRA